MKSKIKSTSFLIEHKNGSTLHGFIKDVPNYRRSGNVFTGITTLRRYNKIPVTSIFAPNKKGVIITDLADGSFNIERSYLWSIKVKNVMKSAISSTKFIYYRGRKHLSKSYSLKTEKLPIHYFKDMNAFQADIWTSNKTLICGTYIFISNLTNTSYTLAKKEYKWGQVFIT